MLTYFKRHSNITNVDKIETKERRIKVVDTQRLNRKIKKSGLKKYYIASKIGLTTYGLQKKISNQTQFKANEIEVLCRVLQIETLEEKESIFLQQM